MNDESNKLSENVPYYYSHFLNYYKENNDTNKILDPMSTIIRLGLLKYKENGTKISVENNKLIYSKPNTWVLENLINYQGFYRGIFGYSRLDLILLYPPILRVMYWHLNLENSKKKEEIETNLELKLIKDKKEDINNILLICKKSLKLLKNLYETFDGRTELFLEHCIKKIESCLENNFEYDSLDNQIILDEKMNLNLFNTIKMLWSDKEINIISEKLIDIEEHILKHRTLECQAIYKYISMINEILDEKDKEFKNMLIFNKVGNNVSKN
jgi:hypothetical protein